MPSATNAIDEFLPHGRWAYARFENPYRRLGETPMARSSSDTGPSWTLFNTVVTLGIGIIITLIGIIYANVRSDITDLKTAAVTAAQSISDIRVDVASIKSDVSNMKTNVSQILERLPKK
jgi:hypothetical protein